MRLALGIALLASVMLASCGDSSPGPGGTDSGSVSSDAGRATTDSGSVRMDAGPVADGGGSGDTDAGGGARDAAAMDGGNVASDGGSDTDADAMCGPGTHVCLCATGYYCLFAGAACISPSSPCPT